MSPMERKQKEESAQFWREGAKEAFDISKLLFRQNYYNHALFYGHLTLEKLLKSAVIDMTGELAAKTHDLLYLCGIANIELNKAQEEELREINSFNIEGRYREEKDKFYRKATKEFAAEWLKNIEELYLWLSAKSKEK